MGIVTTTMYECDGCGIASLDRHEFTAEYEITKTLINQPSEKPKHYKRLYCSKCAPKILATHREGAFKL